jgi:(R)-2-hydroxyacyl-CoA dehydratese activating ATPase
MITAGIDIGSAAIKIIFVKGNNIIWNKTVPTVPGAGDICKKLFNQGMEILTINKDDVSGIAVTGYGRRLFPEAEKIVDEISANAFGAYLLSKGRARSVINIGGQDVKIIRITPEGKIDDFKMNDKCAAGTGRFFEMAGRILDTPVDEFSRLSEQSESPVTINSTCTVFAESEIVSLIAQGKTCRDIIAGLHRSLARRIYELKGAMALEDEIYLDGGPGANTGLLSYLEEEFMREIKVFDLPQFTVAYGAARLLSEDRK